MSIIFLANRSRREGVAGAVEEGMMDVLRVRQFVMNRFLVSVTAALLLAGCGGGDGGSNCSSICPSGVTNISFALDVAVADFNGDGQPDVALAVAEGVGFPGTAALFPHMSTSGKGYSPRQDYAANSDADTIIAADLNGDGHPDIVMSSANGGTVAVLLNDAANPGTFTLAQTLNLSNAAFTRKPWVT